MRKHKIVVPFHRGQKVRVGSPENSDSVLDYNCEAIVYEISHDLYSPSYSLLTIPDFGGGAWYSHDILTLIEETTVENLKLLEKHFSPEEEDEI